MNAHQPKCQEFSMSDHHLYYCLIYIRGLFITISPVSTRNLFTLCNKVPVGKTVRISGRKTSNFICLIETSYHLQYLIRITEFWPMWYTLSHTPQAQNTLLTVFSCVFTNCFMVLGGPVCSLPVYEKWLVWCWVFLLVDIWFERIVVQVNEKNPLQIK